MAKPPKKITGSSSPEVPAPDRSPSPDALDSSRVDSGHSLPGIAGTDPRTRTAVPDTLPGTSGEQSSILVSGIPDRQIPSPTRPALTSQPPTTSQTSSADPVRALTQHPVFLDAQMAAQLKRYPGTSEGIRYDKFKKAYVEMADGMVMVHKGPDGYRQTHAGEASPTGALVEFLPEQNLWRQISPAHTPSRRRQSEADVSSSEVHEPAAGPSKRPRQVSETSDEVHAAALALMLFSGQSGALDLSADHWKNWGRTTRPESGQSIEIDAKHYSIVPQTLNSETNLVYLQHPGFKPEGFDAFEDMLRHNPSHQPKWVIKREGQWRVVDNHAPFAMPLSQYVRGAYRYLSDHSTRTIARAVFDRACLPEGISGHVLSTLAMTFRHWSDRANYELPLRDFSDPLVMLPRIPTQPDNLMAGGILTLPARGADLLQRLDFDPQHFPAQWDSYQTTPTPASLRNVFITLLQDNGYVVNPTLRSLNEGAVIFHREGVAAVFVLRLPRITGNTVVRHTVVGSELTSPDFQSQLSQTGRATLNSHLARGEVIYLVGGIQPSPPGPTLVIVREG